MRLILLLSVGCVLLVSLPAHAALKGVAHYERGNYARARRVLEQELRSPKLTEEERIKARLYLAASLHALDAKEAASVQLEELVLTAPNLEVDPVLFPPSFVELAGSIRQRVEDERKRVDAERQRVEAERLAREEAERLAREQAARPPPPPVAPQPVEPVPAEQETGSLRLRPEVFGFVAPLGGRSFGVGGGLTFGFGGLEAGARVLLGEDLGVGAEVGMLLGSGSVQPRLGLRGTFVPGQPSYGGGAVVGLRLRPVSRLTLLVDVGAEYFSAPSGYRPFVLTSSAGIGFDLF